MASCSLDGGQSLLVGEDAGKRADLPHVDAVFVLAEEQLEESAVGVIDHFDPFIEPRLRLRSANGFTHPVDVAERDLTRRPKIAEQLDEKSAVELELHTVFRSEVAVRRENPPRQFRNGHTLVRCASGKVLAQIVRQADAQLRRVTGTAKRLTPPRPRNHPTRSHTINVPRK